MAKNNQSSNQQFSLKVRYWVTGQGPVVSSIPVDLEATKLLGSEATSLLEPVAVEDLSQEGEYVPSRTYRILDDSLVDYSRKEIEQILTSAIVNQKQLDAVLSLINGVFSKMDQEHWKKLAK